jgi:hypothetical protein
MSLFQQPAAAKARRLEPRYIKVMKFQRKPAIFASKLRTMTTRERKLRSVKANVAEELPIIERKIELQTGAPRGISQFTPPIGRASSDRTYPGGLPRLERTSSQSPAELTTLSRVPLSICEMTRAVDDGFSYTDVGRVVS